MAARKIGVVTVGRSDYGILRPILRRLDSDAEVELALIIGGMHLESRFGDTVGEIEDDGFDTSERVGFSVDDDTPHGIARTVGAAVADFADAFARVRPDLVVVLGDRAEMFAAASAAVPLLIPLAHIHGGELSEGAIDDSFRHAMTKMSHLHFVSTEPYAARVRQMGEEDWRVVVSGAPALDNLAAGETASDEELARLVPLDLSRPTLLVTYHPATRAYGTAADAIAELLAALDGADMQVVFTRPNADAENAVISDAIEAFARARPQTACIVDSLGTRGYFALMRCAAAMVGNSSSGIIEAPSFGLPVVNVGERQAGRVRGTNVIDAADERGAIAAAIETALSPAFRANAKAAENPYGKGRASEIIVERLKTVPLDRRLIAKRFRDIPAAAEEGRR